MWKAGRISGRALCGVLVAFLAVFATAPESAWAKPEVRSVRVGDHTDKTRFVIDLSHKIDFSVFTLPDPYRVVIDLPEVDWRTAIQGVPGANRMIKDYRFGLFASGHSRVVLDVGSPVVVHKAFVLAPSGNAGWRFVLDLKETTRTAFLQNRGGVESGVFNQSTDAPTVQAVRPPPSPTFTPTPQPALIVPPNGKPLPTATAWPQTPKPAPPTETAMAPQPKPEPKPQQKPKPQQSAGYKPVIVIDAGHGGVDPGATSVSGGYEKHITLAMARQLKDALMATGRYRVVLTRDEDIFIQLRERVDIARNVGGDLFISVHADTVENPGIKGLSVYTLSENASDKEAAQLAEKENKADLIAGIDLSGETPEVTDILIDLAQRETMNLSAKYAGLAVKELQREVNLLRRTHRFAGFAVLKAPDVPAVLLEIGYLSNRDEEKLLRQNGYRARLAGAVTKAVDRFFSETQRALLQ